jgi:hypothetical protein
MAARRIARKQKCASAWLRVHLEWPLCAPAVAIHQPQRYTFDMSATAEALLEQL